MGLRYANWSRIGLALLFYGCSGDGGADAVRVSEFRVDECKSDASKGTLLSGLETSDYAGLQCVAWNLDDAKGPAIDLINWPAGCGFQGFDHDEAEMLWHGEATLSAENQLALQVEWHFSDPSACGGCLHDFSYRLEPVEAADDLQLSVRIRSCNTASECPWQREALTLPTANKPAGVVCRYADWRSDSGAMHAGILNTPADDACEAGLSPLKIDHDFEICAAECTKNSDCPLPGVLTCKDAMCQIADPW